MNPAPPVPGTKIRAARRATPWTAAVVVVAAAAAYLNTFSCPFVFDDIASIAANPTIRRLWPPGPVLSPPHAAGETVGGRPVLNLSLAANHAISGLRPWSYHLANLMIHAAAGVVLFGLVRRTLAGRRSGPREAGESPGDGGAGPGWCSGEETPGRIAFAVALLWTLHPLQTESVTYVVQRAESLMGLFYLGTLYCFARGSSSAEASADEKATRGFGFGRGEGRGRGWFLASWLCCLFGVGTKEVMVTAPVMVFLYDRTFVGGSFREAWARRWRFHLALAATWIPLALLVAGSGGNRGGTSGFGVGVSWGSYLLTQFPAVLRYLGLAFWPRGLVFDYGAEWVGAGAALPGAAAVALLAAGTAYALFGARAAGPSGRALGFLGAFFFAILAPTSLVPGNRQTMAEHRLYLALVPVVALVVCGAYARFGRRAPRLFLGCVAAAGIASGWATVVRNETYRSALSLWSDTVAKRPLNPYAHNDLGDALRLDGRPAEALAEFQKALEIEPSFADALNNVGNAAVDAGRPADAIPIFERALAARPGDAVTLDNLGVALTKAGRLPEAIPAFGEALRARPDYPEASYNLGVALAEAGRLPEAIAAYEAALGMRPDYAVALNNLGVALARTGRNDEAVARFEAALRLKPDYAEAADNEGIAFAGMGRTAEAESRFRRAIALKPGYAGAHFNLGNAMAASGRMAEAAAEYEQAVRLAPDNADAQVNLGNALLQLGRPADAIGHYELALRARPGFAAAHANLGTALREVGRLDEARAQFSEAERLRTQGPARP